MPGAGAPDCWDSIARVTPDGRVTDYTIGERDGMPASITRGPDGNVWFAERWRDYIGKVAPDGEMTEYRVHR